MKFPWWRKKEWKQWDIAEIRKRSRLLVIDDSEFPYQVLFERDGYNIDKWSDVEDLPRLESGYYDLLLLDIQGVGAKHSHEDGLGILKHLNKVCPALVVIAYSTADFSLEKKEFFDLADDTLAKGEDYLAFKRAVDKVLGRRYALGFYLDRVAKLASSYVPNADRIREAAELAILTQDPEVLRRAMARDGVKELDVDRALQVIQVAIGILSLP